MLSSFSRHFNETVFRGPDTEGGGGDVEADIDVGGDAGNGGHDDGGGDDGGEGGTPEPLTVREQIKKSIAETSEPAAKPARDKKSGRFGDRAPKEQVAPVVPEAAPAPAVALPADLPKEVAEQWGKTPPEIQAAFIKRGQDMEKGVKELRQRYDLIDKAIAPHTDALRQMNATPADAVDRMFLWFKALAGRPAESFPALAQSMGIDWKRLTSPQAAPTDQAAAQGTASGTAPEIPDPVRQYVGSLERQVAQLGQYVQQISGRFGSVEQNLQSQNMARTQENLTIWSKDKPHFEAVRTDMANLIEKGVIPLKGDQVDLDTAYERAIYFNPEVRAKVLAEQQQANQAAQQQSKDAVTAAQATQVSRARKASVSLPASTTPGSANGVAKPKPGQKLSVRDSLKASIQQLRDQ